MSPYSDVDLMFLYEGELKDASGVVERILYPVWDSKMEAGGATRTIADCKAMFAGDIRAQTAMLDARFITGNADLADKFTALVAERLKDPSWKKKFIRAKYEEQAERFKKFGSSVYVLEPHIKEGEGGLREYQTALWINSVGFKSALKMDPSVMHELEYICRLRAELHVKLGKREDRLTFDNQVLLAEHLKMDVQDLMTKYYRASSTIHREARAITDMAAPLLKRMFKKWHSGRVKKIIGDSPSWQRLVANNDVLADALFMMHSDGELKKMFPSFVDIYHRSQYGAYHVYTVDIHSILAVRKIVELQRTKRPASVYEAYKRIKRRDLLLLTALLHDIGKDGAGKTSHTQKGAKIAFDEALRLGYSRSDAETISFLVESHLIMPRLAFSRDMADRHLIEKFSSAFDRAENLDMLYVLTYADIASIGPDVWNEWKSELLAELYRSSRRLLTDGASKDLSRELEKRKKHLLSLAHNESAALWLSIMPDRYFIGNDDQTVAMHMKMYDGFAVASDATGLKTILMQHVQMGSYSELSVMAHDAPGLFSKIAGIMAANRVNILAADINTGKGGLVFDIFRVQNENRKPISSELADKIRAELTNVIREEKDVSKMVTRSSSGIIRRSGKKEPRIFVDNDVSVYYTVLDIYAGDRRGLLYDLSRILFDENCSISVAKILTHADEAQDSFYVTDVAGSKILEPERISKIKEALLKAI